MGSRTRRLKAWFSKKRAALWFRCLLVVKVILFLVFLAIAALMIFVVGDALYRGGNSNLLVEYSTAFIAAFIGATLSLFVVWLGRITDRLAKHRNGVVFFEHLLAREVDEVVKMRRQLEQAQRALRRGANWVFGRSSIAFSEDRVGDLLDLDLANRLMSLGIDIDAQNRDYATIAQLVDRIRGERREMPEGAFAANMENIDRLLTTLIRRSEELESEMVDCLSRCTYQLAGSAVLYLRLLQWLHVRPYDDELLEQEQQRIRTQRERTAAESAERLRDAGIEPGPGSN